MPHPALIDDIFDEFLVKIRQGATISKALQGTALSYSHLSRRLADKPEMRQRFDEARAEGGARLADTLRDKVKQIALDDEHPKQWNALDRSLEAYVPEFKRKQIVEVTGNAGHWAAGPGEIVDAEFEELPTDELRAIVAGDQADQ